MLYLWRHCISPRSIDIGLYGGRWTANDLEWNGNDEFQSNMGVFISENWRNPQKIVFGSSGSRLKLEASAGYFISHSGISEICGRGAGMVTPKGIMSTEGERENLESFSTYWYAPFSCVCLGCCAAEFGISGGTYKLPCKVKGHPVRGRGAPRVSG